MENKTKNKKVRFNGMDVFICIVILAVAAAAVYMLIGRHGVTTGGGAENTAVTMTVELTGQEQNVADAIKVGDAVSIGEKDKAKMTVSDVEVSPAKTIGYDIEAGRILNSEVPGQVDIKVTMTAEGIETDREIKVDNVTMRVGQSAVLSAKGWAGHGYTIGLETGE